MHSSSALLLAFAVGIVAGLRSMTAPAVTAVAAHLGRLNLQNSALAFMGSKWAAGIFTLAALGELVADKLPMTPARIKPGPLAARIVMGGLCGACIVVATDGAAWIGAVIGGVGAFVGAFAGYRARTGLVRSLQVRDALVAVAEDLIALALGVVSVTRI